MGTDSIPGSSTSHLTSACGLGKQLRMAQSLGTLHSVGDLEEIPGFKLVQNWPLHQLGSN